MVTLMPGELDSLHIAFGALQTEVKTLAATVSAHQESTTREQRLVHDIVVATSEAVRNLARIVDEIKPLAEDYREKRAEARGAARLAGWLYTAAAAGGGIVVAAALKAMEWVSARPHLPVLVFIVVMIWAGSAAFSQEHRHGDELIYGVTGRFYETWDRPDQPGSSCCNRHDCDTAVDVKQVDGRWWARKKGGGPLMSIPAAKVEQRRDSPDGQSHLCAIGSTVLCFLPGGGT
jgi:hypothetical protein